jgi:hypothetical protein
VGEEAVPLAERSPLVRAVATAEQSRVKLYAFFFYLTHDFGGRDEPSAPEHRRELRETLQERLPALVAGALEEVVR